MTEPLKPTEEELLHLLGERRDARTRLQGDALLADLFRRAKAHPTPENAPEVGGQRKREILARLEREMWDELDKPTPPANIEVRTGNKPPSRTKEVEVEGVAGCAAAGAVMGLTFLLSVGLPIVGLAAAVAFFWWLLDVFGVR